MSESSIWNKLRAKGFSEKATAAIMGNMQAESGLIPYRLQGDFGNGYTRSIEYTNKVDNGQISKSEFMYNGPGGGGYGLCQWTYFSRKAGLYDLAKSRGASIGDEQVGIDWFYEELQQAEYKNTRYALFSEASMWDMVATMVRNYEKPYDQSDSAVSMRLAMANDIYSRNAESTPDPEPEPEPDPEPTPDPGNIGIILIRTLRHGSYGRDVYLLQRALEDMGYGVGEYGCDGWFGTDTEEALNEFKSDSSLASDGVADADVWQIIFQ